MHHYLNEGSAIRRLVLVALVSALISVVSSAQTSSRSLHSDFKKGYFKKIVETAPAEIERHRKVHNYTSASEIGAVACQSFIQLQKYDAATKIAEEALIDARRSTRAPQILASILFCKSAISRISSDYRTATNFAKDALDAAPADRLVEAEYYLTIGRIFYGAGYDIASIVWLQKAERLAQATPRNAIYLETLRFLSLAWKSRFHYAKAIEFAERLVEISSSSDFGHRYRLALYEFADLLDYSGQKERSRKIYLRGLDVSTKERIDYHSGQFLSSLLLRSLYEFDLTAAEKYLRSLETVDKERQFEFEILLGKAIVASQRGQVSAADLYFSELAKLQHTSKFIVPYWKSTIAERNLDWNSVIANNVLLRELSEEENFREDLPGIFLKLARSYWGLKDSKSASSYARQAASMIEEVRPVGDASLSLSTLEVYHSVYRLLAEIEEKPDDAYPSFEVADSLKGGVLRNRIDNSVLAKRSELSLELRAKAEKLSNEYIEGKATETDLRDLERVAGNSAPENFRISNPESLRSFRIPKNTAIVSYMFTLSGDLLAYVCTESEPVKVVRLSLSEKNAEQLAESVRRKIRDRIFFKGDGKQVYDQLLSPLAIEASHIVIVPDKSLWKIPFHALSRDGYSYLIEQKAVSYAPSVSHLQSVLKDEPPKRTTAQIFANDTFHERHLAYVNREANKVARIFGVLPVIGATRDEFQKLSGNSDIVHFSMHAQADAEDPLASFLAFKASGNHDGRITVGDLLSVRLKRKSLAFVASCDTNSVLKGEGLVSIGWALLGSGSSSVVSAQWEVNDKSTELFSEQFYNEYRRGTSTAEALRAASVAMIKNKSMGFHEPYYWAAFVLFGDYR